MKSRIPLILRHLNSYLKGYETILRYNYEGNKKNILDITVNRQNISIVEDTKGNLTVSVNYNFVIPLYEANADIGIFNNALVNILNQLRLDINGTLIETKDLAFQHLWCEYFTGREFTTYLLIDSFIMEIRFDSKIVVIEYNYQQGVLAVMGIPYKVNQFKSLRELVNTINNKQQNILQGG